MLEIVWRNPNKPTAINRSAAQDGTDLTHGLTILKFAGVDQTNALPAAKGMSVLPATHDHTHS